VRRLIAAGKLEALQSRHYEARGLLFGFSFVAWKRHPLPDYCPANRFLAQWVFPLSFKCRKPGLPSRKAGLYGQKMGSTK
jgi:hypothetical protein